MFYVKVRRSCTGVNNFELKSCIWDGGRPSEADLQE